MKYNVAFILFFCFLFQQAHAEDSASFSERVNQCTIISSDKERLACFDKLTKKVKIKTKVIVKTVVNKAVKENITIKSAQKLLMQPEKQVANFAKVHIKKTKEERKNELVSITLTIKKLKKRLRGQWVISFENGQKWQQKDNIKLKLKVGDNVTLNKGVLNAVYLKKANNSRTIRVKRIK